jgi:Gluconate 2-dehydrogenase subunit 3
VALDFSRAEHLPNLRGERGPADPHELPRQRRGTTPQMHGRYPDYDVLEQAGHWDEVTRRMVLDRVQNVPPISFFDAREAATVEALCDLLTGQDCEPRIAVLNYVDEKLAGGELDGYQFHDMPDDRETWRLVARGLDEQARERVGSATFAAASAQARREIVADFAQGRLHGGAWSTLNVKRAFSVVMRAVLAAFYSHPWAWNEIGFGGPAYPRGYSRFGSPHLQSAERETWEGREAYDRDPVRGERESPPAS